MDQILTTAHKLKNSKFDINDEWIGTILLAGLPDEYRPMIMAIESSKSTVSSDFVKTKLLQDAVNSNVGEKAMYSKPKKSIKSKSTITKCFECDKEEHFARDCRVRKQKHILEKQQQNSNFSYSCFATGAKKSNDWFIDSGASAHMTHTRKWIMDPKLSARDTVTVANNDIVNVECTGNVQLHLNIDKKKCNS